MFDRLDANHDGVVTREELRQRHHRRRRDGFAAPAPPTDR
jgi:Ca2+-binding EF-hand superfamily protein